MDEQKSVKLLYKIHKFSSYSASYIPENVLLDKPMDQLSRWFTDSSTQSQFLTLKLNSPCIVETIRFGKFFKSHVSNLKKFQILGGTDETNLSVLLSAGLKNDSNAEVFRLRHKTVEGIYLPLNYIKIVPVQSWGPAYNYSIWFVELRGKNHEDFISNALETITLRKEEEAVRLLLKHLRRRRYKDAFEALSRESGVRLEGAVQSRLWNALVENGDYKLTEKIFEEAADDGELDWYMSWQPYTPAWRLMSPCSSAVEAGLRRVGGELAHSVSPHDLHSVDPELRADLEGPENFANGDYSSEPDDAECGPAGCCGKPGPRGGHQLVVDSASGTLYLFGGWNGTEDLDDLWAYCTRAERWTLLCRHSAAEGGPSPRSCHKMVFDPVQRRLYTLGRYLDNAERVPANMNSDLYSFDAATGAWALLCGDTAAAGGPRLVFDHQMCIDADTQTVYVFGGRVLPVNTDEGMMPQYSGLYAYYIRTNTWELLLADKHDLHAPQPRVSHSMLFHPVSRRLYIFAGQRNKEHLVDLWWWDVRTGEADALCRAAPAPPPAAGFTQRATLDPDTDEMYVLSASVAWCTGTSAAVTRRAVLRSIMDTAVSESTRNLARVLEGMSKEKEKRVYNMLWVFSLRRLTWTCVYRNESAAPHEPRPRFAHQLVFDPVRKIHYLFGGNPGKHSAPRLRLDDLWELRLARRAAAAVRADAAALVREAAYRALAAAPRRQLQALHYLRTDLRELVDVADPGQVARFHKLATALFTGGDDCPWSAGVALTPQRTRALARRRADASARADMERMLAVVLGVDDGVPEPTQPFEEAQPAPPDTWEVGRDEDGAAPGAAWLARQRRMELYDALTQYFPPSAVPPRKDVMELVTL